MRALNDAAEKANTTPGIILMLDVGDLREGVIDYISDMALYEEVTVKGNDYILVHAGIAEFDAMVSLDEYMPEDFISEPLDADAKYYEDKTIVVGCTPTSELGSANKIFRSESGNIFINCGETLGCLCLDTNEEFYV